MPLSNLYVATTSSSASSTPSSTSDSNSQASETSEPWPSGESSSKTSSRSELTTTTTTNNHHYTASSSPQIQFNNRRKSNNKSTTDRCNTNGNKHHSSSLAKTSNSLQSLGKGIRKRVMANERERERTKSLNQALEVLRNRLPVSDSEKRSKIQTLRTAKEYIEFLAKVKRMSALEGDNSNCKQQEITVQQHSNNQQACPRRLEQAAAIVGEEGQNEEEDSDEEFLTVQQQAFCQDRLNFSLERPPNCTSSRENETHSKQQLYPDAQLAYKFYKFRLKSKTRS